MIFVEKFVLIILLSEVPVNLYAHAVSTSFFVAMICTYSCSVLILAGAISYFMCEMHADITLWVCYCSLYSALEMFSWNYQRWQSISETEVAEEIVAQKSWLTFSLYSSQFIRKLVKISLIDHAVLESIVKNFAEFAQFLALFFSNMPHTLNG